MGRSTGVGRSIGKKVTPAKKGPAKRATPAKKKPVMAIEAIVGQRTKKGMTEYEVKWVGFGHKDNTWEPENQLNDYKNKKKCIKEFEEQREATQAPAKSAPKKVPTVKKATSGKNPAPAKPKKATPAKQSTPAPPQRGRGRPAGSTNKASARKAAEMEKNKLVAELLKSESDLKPAAKKPTPKQGKRGADDASGEAAQLIAQALEHFSNPPPKRQRGRPAKLQATEKQATATKKPVTKKRPAPTPSALSSKAKKPKVAGKTTPAKKKAIFKLKKLLSVRKTKDGKREYEVQWESGPNSWEPEANISDDSIEEFETQQMSKASAKAKLKVGVSVEVLSTAEGFQWSWAAAKLVSEDKNGKFGVEYALFVDSKGKKLKENKIERSRIRPAPKASPKNWYPELGDKIEVFEDDCWWESTVTKCTKNQKDVHVMLRVSDETRKFATKNARPCLWEKLE